MADLLAFEASKTCGKSRLGQMIPRFFGGGFGEDSGYYLILEDVSSKGFRSCDFNEGLEAGQVRSALNGLGYFHAVTYSFAKENDGKKTYPHLRKCYTDPDIKAYIEGYVKEFVLCDLIEDISGTRDSYLIGHLSDLGSKLEERIAGLMLDRVKLFNHGDFWGNNLMFNETSGETAFVDWQFFGMEGPFFDLGQGAILSMDPEKTEKHLVSTSTEKMILEAVNVPFMYVGFLLILVLHLF